MLPRSEEDIEIQSGKKRLVDSINTLAAHRADCVSSWKWDFSFSNVLKEILWQIRGMFERGISSSQERKFCPFDWFGDRWNWNNPRRKSRSQSGNGFLLFSLEAWWWRCRPWCMSRWRRQQKAREEEEEEKLGKRDFLSPRLSLSLHRKMTSKARWEIYERIMSKIAKQSSRRKLRLYLTGVEWMMKRWAEREKSVTISALVLSIPIYASRHDLTGGERKENKAGTSNLQWMRRTYALHSRWHTKENILLIHSVAVRSSNSPDRELDWDIRSLVEAKWQSLISSCVFTQLVRKRWICQIHMSLLEKECLLDVFSTEEKIISHQMCWMQRRRKSLRWCWRKEWS